MKKIFILILINIMGFVLIADTPNQYEQDLSNYEKEIISKHNLISKKQALDKLYKSLILHYANINKEELKQMISSDDVILVEEITPSEIKASSSKISFFYSVHAKSKDDRILAIYSINAETGESIDGMIMNANDKSDFISILNRNEIIQYVKKYVSFPENSKLIIRAVFDYSFYQDVTYYSLTGFWKYRITIENDSFNSPSLPAGITAIFITPYVRGYDGKKETPASDNEIGSSIKHRLYTYNHAYNNGNSTESRTLKPENQQSRYVGID